MVSIHDDVSYGYESATGISLDTSASDMKGILSQLIGPNVQVTRHEHNDMGAGVAWAVTYRISSNEHDQIREDDTHVTRQTAPPGLSFVFLPKREVA